MVYKKEGELWITFILLIAADTLVIQIKTSAQIVVNIA